jgi:hypothetical protein
MDIQQELLRHVQQIVAFQSQYPIVTPLEYSSMLSLTMSSSLEDWNYSSSLSSTGDERCGTAKMIKQRWCKVSHQTS